MSETETDLIHVLCPLCSGNETRYERTLRGFTLERCSQCNFVYVNPQYPPEKLAEIYTDHTAQRDSEKLVALYAKMATPKTLRAFDETLQRLEALVPAKGRLLDFGCAAGYFYERALDRGWEAHGIDMGEWCSVAAAQRGLPNMHIGRLEELQFPDAYFDVIYSTSVFEHIPQPLKELAAISRLLRPGGILYLTVPNYQCLSIVLARDDFELNEPPQHVNYFVPQTMRVLLEKAGYTVESITSGNGIKWENLLGRRIHSDIANARRMDTSQRVMPSSAVPGTTNGRPSPLKRLVYPLYKSIFYEGLKVGMSLIAIARKLEPGT